MFSMTLRELLEALDGHGLVVTDDDDIQERLEELRLSLDTVVESQYGHQQRK